ncbi:hypothetical protein [Caenispirillum bisanense]|uniref:hypothetical protein n=1 Tax=Caenispirillum bisanense TaxID=414052 RepID=UPI0031D9CEF8
MGGLPKARVILRLDAILSALTGLALLGLAPFLAGPQTLVLWPQAAGILLLALAAALATPAAAGPAAARVVCGAGAIANLGTAAVVVGALGGASAASLGGAAAAGAALLAVVRLALGVLEALYWGRLKGAAAPPA